MESIDTQLKSETWVSRINNCKTPDDFLKLFKDLGIPGNNWKSSNWMEKIAHLKKEEGGIARKLSGLSAPIRRRFSGYPNFVAWMEGRDKPDESCRVRVNSCKTPADFLNLFNAIGVPEGKWKSCSWMEEVSKLPVESGGAGINFSGLTDPLRERFGGYPKFVAWMEGKDKPDDTWIDKVNNCGTPDDFLKMFLETGIPADKWKNSAWMQAKAKLAVDQGGIGIFLAGLKQAIKKRFGSHRKFLAWMEDREDIDQYCAERIRNCRTKDDFLKLFKDVGVNDDRWKSCEWLNRKTKLPKEQGGIGKNLSGYGQAISKRFGGYPKFVAWMEGKDKPDDSISRKVKNCRAPEDFITLFKDSGVPGDKWKSSSWLSEVAKLPKEKGGVEYNFAGLSDAIRRRFGGHPKFVAWMEGKDKPDDSWVDNVNNCKTPDDFLNLFKVLGVPGDRWKSCLWMTDKAKLPRDQGGAGVCMSGLSTAIRGRFGGHPRFVAWMEDRTLPEDQKIESIDDVRRVIREQAEKLGITTDELLNPEKISEYIRSNPAIKAALKFLR